MSAAALELAAAVLALLGIAGAVAGLAVLWAVRRERRRFARVDDDIAGARRRLHRQPARRFRLREPQP